MLAEESLGGRTNTEPVLKLLISSVSYPCNFRSKALNVILFLLKKAFRNEHRHTNVFVAGFLEHSIKDMLNVLPDSIAVRANYHTALNAGIFDEFGFFADVSVPLREILVHRGDRSDHFFILCHIKQSSFLMIT